MLCLRTVVVPRGPKQAPEADRPETNILRLPTIGVVSCGCVCGARRAGAVWAAVVLDGRQRRPRLKVTQAALLSRGSDKGGPPGV